MSSVKSVKSVVSVKSASSSKSNTYTADLASIERFIAKNKLDAHCKTSLIELLDTPALLEKVFERGDIEEARNPNAICIGRIGAGRKALKAMERKARQNAGVNGNYISKYDRNAAQKYAQQYYYEARHKLENSYAAQQQQVQQYPEAYYYASEQYTQASYGQEYSPEHYYSSAPITPLTPTTEPIAEPYYHGAEQWGIEQLLPQLSQEVLSQEVQTESKSTSTSLSQIVFSEPGSQVVECVSQASQIGLPDLEDLENESFFAAHENAPIAPLSATLVGTSRRSF